MKLNVVVVDDEEPQLDELCFLLRRDERIGEIQGTTSAADALRLMRESNVDAVFLDIQMPGLTGLDLAKVLSNFKSPPPIVFVTAHEGHAVQAFELEAIDYVLKPVREERLARAVGRVIEQRSGTPSQSVDEHIAVELGGVTRFVARSEIGYAEAQGDYARLHTTSSSHLLRTPLTTLEQTWAEAGFVRIHRSLLVNLAHVEQMRMEEGKCTVSIFGRELLVSRRHTRELRELLGRRGRPGR
ncbi:MAG: LytTR family DNA-binding domain-containing protein [Marmoricola sp.]